MGPLIFVVLVGVLVVVIGFVLYGMLLGMAALGRAGKRLFWPELPETRSAAGVLQLPALATAATSQRRCWDVKGCATSKLETCPAYKHPDLPCWVATMRADEGYRLKPDCVACTQFSLPALLN